MKRAALACLLALVMLVPGCVAQPAGAGKATKQGAFGSGGGTSNGGSYRCPNCGATSASAGMCPSCNTPYQQVAGSAQPVQGK